MNFGSLVKAGVIIAGVAGGVYFLNKKAKEAVSYFKQMEVEHAQRLERQLNIVKRFAAAAGYQMDEYDLAVISETETALNQAPDMRILEPLMKRVNELMDKISASVNAVAE